MAPLLTVAICTLDRPNSLMRALGSLESQSGEGRFDIVVADNSPRETARVASETFAARFDRGAMSYLPVRELGLSQARNAALEYATTQFVSFLDDDVTVPPEWLDEMSAGLTDSNPAVAGGPVRLAWDGGRPRWMQLEHEGLYSSLDLGDASRDFRVPFEAPVGTNLVVDRVVALAHGGFDIELGRKGSGLVGAEDLDIAVRLGTVGRVRYLPKAWVFHHVEPERARRRWLLRRYYTQGKTWELLETVRQAIGEAEPARPGLVERARGRSFAGYVRLVGLLPYRAAHELGRRRQRRIGR